MLNPEIIKTPGTGNVALFENFIRLFNNNDNGMTPERLLLEVKGAITQNRDKR